mmetsp:Transcript_22261/g.31104  ORF Transcript_22261/g.31104 Transcript_22261/m.31104 type:complete len:135 (-) Transcript_22261:238-642(-)
MSVSMLLIQRLHLEVFLLRVFLCHISYKSSFFMDGIQIQILISSFLLGYIDHERADRVNLDRNLSGTEGARELCNFDMLVECGVETRTLLGDKVTSLLIERTLAECTFTASVCTCRTMLSIETLALILNLNASV